MLMFKLLPATGLLSLLLVKGLLPQLWIALLLWAVLDRVRSLHAAMGRCELPRIVGLIAWVVPAKLVLARRSHHSGA